MKKIAFLVAVVLVLSCLPAYSGQAKWTPTYVDGEIVLPDYVPFWPICFKPVKHKRKYGEEPCPCVTTYTEAICSLCYYPQKHLKQWQRRGYCDCVEYITPDVLTVCRKPRKHLRFWKKDLLCPCFRRYNGKDVMAKKG